MCTKLVPLSENVSPFSAMQYLQVQQQQLQQLQKQMYGSRTPFNLGVAYR